MEKYGRWESMFRIEEHGGQVKIINYINGKRLAVILTLEEWEYIQKKDWVRQPKYNWPWYERKVGTRKIERGLEKWRKNNVQSSK